MTYNDMDVLFIGGIFSDDRKDEIIRNSKAAIQNAANKLQWMYINGIENNIQSTITLINGTYIGTYPKYYKKAILKGKMISRDKRKLSYDVGFVNLPIVANTTKFLNMKKYIKKWCTTSKNNKKVVIGYGFFEEVIKALAYAKQLDKDIVTCLIVVDLPEFMSQANGESPYHRYLQKRSYKVFANAKQYIDSYVCITSQIKERLSIDSPSIIIEGMVVKATSDIRSPIMDMRKILPEFVFMYSGGLSYEYGTTEMLAAFRKLEDKRLRLLVCGDGPLKDSVVEAARIDSRIQYLGVIPQEECVKLQRRANCLLNPRLESELTLYSFPSKMLEYLASGTPVIGRLLPGMPVEYKDKFFLYNDGEELANVMQKVFEMDQQALLRKSELAYNFVSKNKNNFVQTKRLLEFISTL